MPGRALLLFFALLAPKGFGSAALSGLRHGQHLRRITNATVTGGTVTGGGGGGASTVAAVTHRDLAFGESNQLLEARRTNARLAADQLIHFILAHSAPTIDFEDFLPQCLAHVNKVVRMVDVAYTDAQLEAVLKNECKHSDEFPLTYGEDPFRQSEACIDFAEQMAAARHQQLDSAGSNKPYEEFCGNFFNHHGGRLEPRRSSEPPPEQPKGISLTFAAITVLVCVGFVVAAWLVLRQ